MTENLKSLSREDLQRYIEGTFLLQRAGDALFRVKGREGLDLLHRLSTNALVGMKEGDARGTCFLTNKGRLVDFAVVLSGRDETMLIVSPGNAVQVAAWIERFIIMEDATVERCTGQLEMLSVIGPRSLEIVGNVMGFTIDPWTHKSITVKGQRVLILRRGSPEIDRYDIIHEIGQREALDSFHRLMPFIEPEVAETLRVWRGIPASPGEISEDFNPYEAGLMEFLDERKGCYVGQEVVARLATYDKIQRRLTGIILSDRTDRGAEILQGGQAIGKLSSLSRHSVAGWYPGLAIVRKAAVNAGLPITAAPQLHGFLKALPFSFDSLPNSLPALSIPHPGGNG